VTRRGRLACARVAVVAGSVLLLEALCRAGVISRLAVIPPSEMARSMAALIGSGKLTQDFADTALTVGAAFAAAVAAGGALGVLIHAAPRARRMLDPLLASYYSIPVFAFYPLLVAIFGLGLLPLMAIGFISAMPAMLISTLIGLDRVPGVLRRVALIYRLGPVQTAVRIILPAALPYIFNGLKLSLAYAFIGVIAGEFILSSGGLGYAIAYAYESFDNRTMYGALLFVLLIATVTNGLLYAWEMRLLRRRTGG